MFKIEPFVIRMISRPGDKNDLRKEAQSTYK